MGKLVKKLHASLFGKRCEVRKGIKYFTYLDFNGLKTEPFAFKNSNGFELNGMFYYYSKKSNDKLVVFAHGMGGGHEAYTKEIEYLARAGFTVLGFDYQGTILSEGDQLGGFYQGLSDLDCAITYIENNYKYKEIYLIGHSWGAFNVMNVAYKHPTVKKLVALSGFLDVNQVFRDTIQSPLKFLSKGLTKIEETKHPEYKGTNSIIGLNLFKGKALIMHSTDDNIVDFKNSFLAIKDGVKIKDNLIFDEYKHKCHNITYTDKSVQNLIDYIFSLEHATSDEEISKLQKKVNFDSLCELDKDVMNKIVNFLN